ncbi:hypothetical protein [Myroides sp. DF42-4-2]|uniref:hypothetical protein n=1 Tax=unclassified Myroides TaxID=2642485 RepID=UPI002574C171|nr:hypothetical protein [Myroides sp. DF42-4-2]MDM1406801.1 hypothetical protein [Myroides sp. DF42-4-2]
MKLIKYIQNFWLDFFAANYQRLIKNAKYETPLSIIMHTSFTQAVNFNTVLVIVLHLFFTVELSFIVLFLPIVVLILINSYLFYIKFSIQKKENILNRKPQYRRLVYDLYDVFSTVLFVLSLIFYSKE